MQQARRLIPMLCASTLLGTTAFAASPIRHVRDYCGMLEKRIVSFADKVAKANDARLAAGDDAANVGEARTRMSSSNSELEARENEWNRLACAQILDPAHDAR